MSTVLARPRADVGVGATAGCEPASDTPAAGSEFDETLPIAAGRMAGSSSGMTRGAGATRGLVLFAEDFDLPPQPVAAPEPEIIEPTFTKAELETACRQAWEAGQDAAAATFTESNATEIRNALVAISAGMAEARAQAAATAQQAADELARLLFDCFAAAFPSLCAAYGEVELRDLVRALLPALRQERSLTIHVNPAHATGIRSEIERADPNLAARMNVVACDTIQPGDIRIVWSAGQATRDAAALWKQIVEVLAPAGLASYAAAKEPEHAD